MKTEVKNVLSVTLRNNDIKFLNFSTLKKLPADYPKLDKDIVQFEFNASININHLTQNFHIDLTINFYANIEKTKKLGFISSSGDFEVTNLAEILKQEENKIPLMLLGNIAGLVISATRGFLILKSVGTIMEGLMLPLMDPTRIFAPQDPLDKTT